MIRKESLTAYQWKMRNEFVDAYHSIHEQMHKEPFVDVTRFDDLTFAQWQIILDKLQEFGVKI